MILLFGLDNSKRFSLPGVGNTLIQGVPWFLVVAKHLSIDSDPWISFQRAHGHVVVLRVDFKLVIQRAATAIAEESVAWFTWSSEDGRCRFFQEIHIFSGYYEYSPKRCSTGFLTGVTMAGQKLIDLALDFVLETPTQATSGISLVITHICRQSAETKKNTNEKCTVCADNSRNVSETDIHELFV